MSGDGEQAAATAADVKLNKRLFWSRLDALMKTWRAGGKHWADADALVLTYGPTDETPYRRNASVQLYLFGFEFDLTIMLLTEDTLHVLTSPKKMKILSTLGDANAAGTLKLNLLAKNKVDKNVANYDTLVSALKASRAGKVAGIIPKSDTSHKFVSAFMKTMVSSSITTNSVALGYAHLFAHKDKDAVTATTAAASYASTVLRKQLLPAVESTIDEERSVTHEALAEQTDDAIMHPQKLKSALEPSLLETCYTPIVMSGGNYSLLPSAQSDAQPLHHGSIICALGVRYNSMCSNVARTYFINPDDSQKQVYGVLLQVHTACKAVMRPGIAMKKVMEAAHGVIARQKPALSAHFTQNCGFAMGLEFRESAFLLNDKNAKKFEPGMIFNLCVGFDNLKRTDAATAADGSEDERAKTYACMIADTVVVTEDEPEVLTNVKRDFKEVAYYLGDDSDDSSSSDSDDEGERARGVTRDRLRDKETVEGAESRERREHQAELEKRKQEEMIRKFSNKRFDSEFDAGKASKANGQFIAYENNRSFPSKATVRQVHVDNKAESIICPIAKQLVPFHIGTLRTVTKSERGGYTFLRLNFLTPDVGFTSTVKMAKFANPRKHFVRELTYRCKGKSLDNVFFDINHLKRGVAQRAKEFEEKASIVAQEKLQMTRVRIALLRDVSILPRVSRKKVTGTVEVHLNGLRYTSTDKEKVDIIYSNVAHAFFQPAHKTVRTLLHFHLKNDIVVNKKKTKYVQFYYEVVDAAQDVNASRSYNDQDGLREEEEERRTRLRWNTRFKDFSAHVEEASGKYQIQHKIEFDSPYHKLAFEGVPNKASVQLLPTVHCLVALDDVPPLVLALEDIEIAVFERVQFSLRQFDISFVFKDYARPVLRINAVPSQSLETVKQWLNRADVKYYETSQNMNWKQLMHSITSDIEGFFEEGGWSFLNPEEAGSGTEESETDESEFEMDSDFSESSEDYTSDEIDSEDESDISEENSEEDVSWEELEKKAKSDDRERAAADADRERRQREKDRAAREAGGGGSSKKRKTPFDKPDKKKKKKSRK